MKRILVIEDAEDVRSVIAETLQARGWATLVAEDGDEGAALARQEIPDLILCDIKMPRMDGYAVLQQLRENPATAAVPFIFLTGLGDRDNVRQGMELGADDYLLKPFTVQELTAAVEARFRKQDLVAQTTERKLSEVRESLTFALPHELVTPLNTILGFSALLLETGSLQNGEIREYAQHIQDAGKRLRALIEKFLLYAQLEAIGGDPEQALALQKLPPAPLGEGLGALALRVAREMGRERDLALKIESVHHGISAAHLERLIKEMLENAFKFSQPGTPVTVWALKVGSRLHITVQDCGQGLSAEQIRSVTANLQFDRKLREQQGTGLGLGIVRRLAELYGGALKIESINGEQTNVTVQLPS